MSGCWPRAAFRRHGAAGAAKSSRARRRYASVRAAQTTCGLARKACTSNAALHNAAAETHPFRSSSCRLHLGRHNAVGYLASLDSPNAIGLVPSESPGSLLPLDWLVFLRQGTLFAQRLDPG